jgi:hypothetical protein
VCLCPLFSSLLLAVLGQKLNTQIYILVLFINISFFVLLILIMSFITLACLVLQKYSKLPIFSCIYLSESCLADIGVSDNLINWPVLNAAHGCHDRMVKIFSCFFIFNSSLKSSLNLFIFLKTPLFRIEQ